MKLSIRSLSITLLLLSSTLAYADCRTYQGGLTECTGPGGYQASQRDYTGGVSETWDNRGNRATLQRHTGGYTTVIAPTGIAPSVSAPGVSSIPNYGSRTVTR